MYAWSAWKPRGDRSGESQTRALSQQGFHRHGNESRIAVGKLDRHVHVREIVVMREVDCLLRMREVVGFRFGLGPGIGRLHVLERASVLQQYLHGWLGVGY